MKILVLKLIFFVCLLAGICFNASCQDYVITAKGDSIPCRIIIHSFTHLYQLLPRSETIKIKPDGIREYYMAKRNQLYHSVFIPRINQPMFLSVLIKGKMSLYELSNGNDYLSLNGWYASKGSDTAIAIRTSGFNPGIIKPRKGGKDDFGNLLMDNKEAYSKYANSDKFTINEIKSIIYFYNTGQWVNDPGR